MNRIKKLISLLLVSILLFLTTGFSMLPDNLQVNINKFTDKSIAEIIEYGTAFMEDSQPEKSITLTHTIPMYDLSNNVTGYYLIFQDNGVDAGYILVSLLEEGSPIAEFSFEGKGPIEAVEDSPQKRNAINLKSFSLSPQETNALSLRSIQNHQKVIYEGGGAVFIPDTTGSYMSIYTHDTIENKKELETILNEPNTNAITPYGSIYDGVLDWGPAKIKSSSVFKINNFGAGTDYRLMNSFAPGGVCSPTAAANLLWYWGSKRGRSSVMNQSNVKKASGTWAKQQAIFDFLRAYMNTDELNGTKDNMILVGYRHFFRFEQPSTGGIWNVREVPNGSSFNTFKAALNDQCPIHLSVKYYKAWYDIEGHSLFNFGYATSSTGTPYLFVMDGWNTYGRFVKMDYYYKLSGYKIWVR